MICHFHVFNVTPAPLTSLPRRRESIDINAFLDPRLRGDDKKGCGDDVGNGNDRENGNDKRSRTDKGIGDDIQLKLSVKIYKILSVLFPSVLIQEEFCIFCLGLSSGLIVE